LLAATNPVMLGYGPLLSSDVAYTSVAMLAGWLAWRWLQRPDLMRLLALGAGLGALVATKYTAALSVAGLTLALTLAAVLGFQPWPSKNGGRHGVWRRVMGVHLALAAAAIVALGVLYAAYLFAVGPLGYDGVADLTSPLLQSVRSLPLASTVLAILPEPMVQGVDHQAVWASTKSLGTFAEYQGNHWAYFLLTVLFKTPVMVLLGAMIALATACRSRAALQLWAVVLLPALAVLTYCSATRALQMGIRYVMPVVPALMMLAAAGLSRPWLRGRVAAFALALVVGLGIYDVACTWPYGIGYFNALAGGPTGGCLIVPDHNCDWDQRLRSKSARLAADYPAIEFLNQNAGPRFGPVAVYAYELKRLDPSDPTRVYHWLRRFRPFDNDGAAWFAYDVSPEDFKTAIDAGDQRAAADLAMAWLRHDDTAAALRVLAAIPKATRGPWLNRIAGVVAAYAAAGEDSTRMDRVAGQLETTGYPELALSVLDRKPRGNALAFARLMAVMGKELEAINWLEQRTSDGSRTFTEVYLMVLGLVDGGPGYGSESLRAQSLMEQGPAPPLDSVGYAAWTDLQRRVQDAIKRERRLGRIK